MADRYSLQNIASLQNRKVFFDANVLIYIFWPTGSYTWETNYSSAYGKLLRQKTELVVDFLVISEVINRVVRIEHQKINPTQKFKDFRNSQDGKAALNDIYIIVKNDILSRFNVVGKIFNKKEIESCLIVDELDFVDKSTFTLCKENTLVLLTNDRDFKNADIDILTGNPSILI